MSNRIPALLALIALALPAVAASPRHGFIPDFDGDAHADILWQGPATAGWLMAGATMRNGNVFPAPAGAGDTVFTGDFNGDGKTDFLWRGATDDRYDVVLVNGLSESASALVSPAGSGWEAVGIGDFDHDGKADILWKNAAGDFRITYMDGAGIRESDVVLTARPELSVAAIADFDGDGRSDILWSAADGSVWLSTPASLASLATRKLLDAGSGWWPAAVGDFNGDGHADIVWRHPDGRHGVWYMDNPLSPRYSTLIDAGTGWSVKFVRDLDGDGRSDLVWNHADGSYAAWLMSDSTPKAYGTLLGAATGWSIVAVEDYDGDGKDDFLWRDGSGTYAMWLMNGLHATSYRTLMAGGSGWDSAVAREGCDRTQAGSFSIVGSSPGLAASGSTFTNGTKLIHVRRTPGACGGAFTVGFNATFTPFSGDAGNYAPMGVGTITFADGEPGIKSIAVTTGGSPGAYSLSLTSAQSTTTGAMANFSGRYSLNVTQASAGCTTQATYSIPASNAQQFIFGTSEYNSYPPLKAGETIAASFTYQPTPYTPATVTVAQVTNPVQGAATDVEIAIAPCPGQFPSTTAESVCDRRLTYPGTAQLAIYGFNQLPAAYCQLTPGKTYFINVRQVTTNWASGATPSCKDPDGCALRVQPQNLN